MQGTVTRIGFTPVKGTRHLDHAIARIEPDGVVGDRVFAFVEPGRARVVRTAEEPSLMSLVTAWDGADLGITLPDGRDVSGVPEPIGRQVDVDYWGRRVVVDAQRGPHAELVSDFLGFEVFLARARPGEVVYGGAVSVVTTAELAELAEELGEPVDPRAFRATLTLDLDRRLIPGERLRVGAVELEVAGGMPRCAVVSADPETGAKAGPVLKTLGRYRHGNGEIWFGSDTRLVKPGEIALGEVASLEDS